MSPKWSPNWPLICNFGAAIAQKTDPGALLESTRVLHRSRTCFSHVSKPSEPQKHMFYWRKTSIFEKSHFFSGTTWVQNCIFLAPKWVPKWLQNRQKSSQETWSENWWVLDLKMVPKWHPIWLHNQRKSSPEMWSENWWVSDFKMDPKWLPNAPLNCL